MSNHSRSSSEIEVVRPIDVLSTFFDDFKDFSFGDVEPDLKQILLQDEREAILNEERTNLNPRCQIIRLFHILDEKDNNVVNTFLDIIAYEYAWLVEKIAEEIRCMSKNTELYIDVLKILRNLDQKQVDYNVLRMRQYVELRSALKKLTRSKKVCLFGELGSGKKWLALDVLSEYTVTKAMDFKIIWLDVNLCQSLEEDIRMLKILNLKLGDDSYANSCGPVNQCTNTNANAIERKLELQQKLTNKLQKVDYENCLLVLVNVQNVKTCETFNLGCKTLIITRNKNVSESLSTSKSMNTLIPLNNGLTLSETNALFDKYIKNEREIIDIHRREIIDIHRLSNGHPYLLSIIAQNLRQKRSDWSDWVRNLQNLKISDNKLATVIEMSLNVLTEDLSKLYATFAIFPPEIHIPVELLSNLWNKTSPETMDIIDKFAKYSLIQKHTLPENTPACSLPIIYSSYLKTNAGIAKKINALELQQSVISYFKIDEKLQHRTEVDLFYGDEHDSYFFHCIGYHLEEAQRTDLLSKLYLDFGFLEQKIRALQFGLQLTITDLKYYTNQICNSDYRRNELMRDICEFLPSVEERLIHSKDTTLLQYGLMASGTVYEEAVRQAKLFPHNVWLNETGNFHQRRQSIALPEQPKLVKLLHPDICLILLGNNNMILANMSLHCSAHPVELINDDNHKDVSIVKVCLFRKNEHVLALDTRGKLKLWDIGKDLHRTTLQRHNSKEKVHPLNLSRSSKMDSNKCRQSVYDETIVQEGKIVTFEIEQCAARDKNDIFLHAVFDSGDVVIFKWNAKEKKFYRSPTEKLRTRLTATRFISKLFNKYMLVSTAGNITFWNLYDTSKATFSFAWPEDTSELISYEFSIFEGRTCVIFIFRTKVLRLILTPQRTEILAGNLETLLEYPKLVITCAKLSSDGRYLVLGTRSGLVIFDTLLQREILRSNVSETITCVDIYALDDPIFKFMIICGSENKRSMNVFALRQTEDDSMTWAHNISYISNMPSNDSQLEPNVWLLGQKLYDITNHHNRTFLVAVDSKHRVHEICTTDTKKWRLVMSTEMSNAITSITTYKRNYFIGYENGAIFNIKLEKIESKFTDMPITFLQHMDETVLIASAKSGNRSETLIRNVQKNFEIIESIYVKKCFRICEQFLLLILDHCIIYVIEQLEKDFPLHKTIVAAGNENGPQLRGCDFKNKMLFLASAENNIYVYSCTKDDMEIKLEELFFYNLDGSERPKITCLVASNDGSLVAIGLNNGDIEIYKVDERKKLTLLHKLQSHFADIYDMKFSPDNTVLASCSEQLCFWNIQHVLNNPYQLNSPKRRSSRFNSQRSFEEEVDHSTFSPTRKHLSIEYAPSIMPTTKIPPWQYKRGSSAKPELLACIKFDGRAKQMFANSNFTQFYIIDNEGVFYNLKLMDFDSASVSVPTIQSSSYYDDNLPT